jgi:hypothetical protein
MLSFVSLIHSTGENLFDHKNMDLRRLGGDLHSVLRREPAGGGHEVMRKSQCASPDRAAKVIRK